MYKDYKFGLCGKCNKKGVQSVDGKTYHCRYCGAIGDPIEVGTE